MSEITENAPDHAPKSSEHAPDNLTADKTSEGKPVPYYKQPPGHTDNLEKPKTKNFGRPMKYADPQKLQEAIDDYFISCENHKEEIVTMVGVATINKPLIPSIAGLAYHIGTDRQTVYNYEKHEPFFDIIKNARNKILSMIESAVVNGEKNPGGKIFVMKNYGYTDKSEIEVTKPLEVVVRDYRGKHGTHEIKEEKD